MTPSGFFATRRSGLTLIEVLVAIAILGVVSAAVVSSFGTLAALNRASQIDATLVSDARTSIEAIRSHFTDPANFAALSGSANMAAAVTAEFPTSGVDVDATCVADSVTMVGTEIARLAVTCTLDGASSPAQFDLDLTPAVAP